jgi:uncharacterized protein DUF397
MAVPRFPAGHPGRVALIALDRGPSNLHPQVPVHEHLHVQLDLSENYEAVRWRKSTASNPSGNCVELAELAGGEIALRNSRFPAGPVLVGTRAAVAAFVQAARSGELDDLAS